MKGIQQISRNNSDSGHDDTIDTEGINYTNLNNNKHKENTQLIGDLSEDSINSQVEDFVNPLFQAKATPPYYNNTSELTTDPSDDSLAYDELNHFKNPRASPQPRTDITKPPEEIEMGVSNYGYNNEKLRPNSWDKGLTAFTPYAVNTPVSGPVVVPLNSRTSSLSTTGKRLSSASKYSDYSSVSDENPYAAPSEKAPQYEDLAAMQAKHQQQQQQQSAVLPARNGRQKLNIVYEPAELVTNHKIISSSTIGGTPKEGYEDENTGYCHVIFTMLVGLIGLIALVVVFLLIFGVISVKKCEECTADKTSTQTGQQTGSGSGSTNAELLEKLQYLQGNVTMLQRALDAIQKPDTAANVTILANEVQQQKLMVGTLSRKLAIQRNLTKSLNQTTVVLKSALKYTNIKLSALNSTSTFQEATLQSLHEEMKKHVSKLDSKYKRINNTLNTVVTDTTNLIKDQLKDKISNANFTKLVNDSQYVVDELVRRINISNTERKQLDESLHSFATQLNNTLHTELTSVQNSTDMIKQDLTQYSSMLTKISTQAIREFINRCSNGIMDSKKKSAADSDKATISQNSTYQYKDIKILSASCGGNGLKMLLIKEKEKLICKCTGLETAGFLLCHINVFYCPV